MILNILIWYTQLYDLDLVFKDPRLFYSDFVDVITDVYGA
jgi:hypothetical protein